MLMNNEHFDDFDRLEHALNLVKKEEESEVTDAREKEDAVEKVEPERQERRKVPASRKRETDGGDQEEAKVGFRLFLPRRMRLFLKFVSIYRQKSMNKCLLEALERYIDDFDKDFRKKYGKKADVMLLFTEIFGDTEL